MRPRSGRIDGPISSKIVQNQGEEKAENASTAISNRLGMICAAGGALNSESATTHISKVEIIYGTLDIDRDEEHILHNLFYGTLDIDGDEEHILHNLFRGC